MFMQTQLEMTGLLKSKAADFQLKIEEKVECIRKAHPERWQKVRAAMVEVQKKVQQQNDIEII